MTREQYIELLQTRLKRLDSVGRFEARYVEGALDAVWQNLVFEMVGKMGTDTFFYTKQYTPVTVTQDANGRYFSVLPDPIINLPRVSSGVVRIGQLAGTDMDFAPCTERDFVMMRSQDVFAISEDIYYHVVNGFVHFGDNMTVPIATAGVRIDMVIPFRSYDLDEHLPIPIGQSERFLGDAIQYLTGTAPVNLSNINSETA